VDALVLSSPALQVTLAWWQRILLALLPPVAPHLKLPNGLDASKLSHDPAVVKAYLNDRRTHNILSPRLAQFIAKSGREVLARAHLAAVCRGRLAGQCHGQSHVCQQFAD
jgi:alpha-beta hydrolase superfamily lysophospholipase